MPLRDVLNLRRPSIKASNIPPIAGIPELKELLENRDADESIESFLERWAPAFYGLNGPLGTINPNEWPILRDLPTNIKAKAMLVAIATYKVYEEDQPHAFIYCADNTTHYVGSSTKFGEKASTHAPRQIRELDGKAVVGIALGPDVDFPNAYFHLSNGTIWCSGDCRCGQLGSGKVEGCRTRFEVVPNLKDIVALQCGTTTCTTMDVQRNIIAFGSNRFGTTGEYSTDKVSSTPQEITSLPHAIKPVTLVCSKSHTVVVGHTQIYSHGGNTFFQLGRESSGPSPTPSHITNLDASQIKKVVCGGTYTICLQTSGNLSNWGRNKNGQLCVGHLRDVREPTEVNVSGKKVIDVVAVDQTTVLLTEDGSVYVCGRWNDEDITTPKRKERNGRDLFAKGLNVTTGGCVRLAVGEEHQTLLQEYRVLDGKRLDVEQQQKQCFQDEQVSHQTTRRQLQDEKLSHETTRQQLQQEKASAEKAQQQLAVEIALRGTTQQQFQDERSAHKRTQEELEALEGKRLNLEQQQEQTLQWFKGEQVSHQTTSRQLQDEKLSHETTRQQLQQEKDSSEKAQQQLAIEIALRGTAQQQFQDERSAHKRTQEELEAAKISAEDLTIKFKQLQEELQLIKFREQSARDDASGWIRRTSCPSVQQHPDDVPTSTSMVEPAVTPQEAYILRKNHRFLLTNLPSEIVKDHLYEEGIIDLLELDDLSVLKTPRDQNEKIIKLINRHPAGYKALIECLTDPTKNTDWIANKLLTTDISQFRDMGK